MATVSQRKIPLDDINTKVVVGDTYLGPVIRHPDGAGGFIDTSLWDITGAIYASNDCGAAKIIDLTILKRPGPEFGYQPTLTAVQTAGLACANRQYKITTDDGTTVRTYISSPALITGLG